MKLKVGLIAFIVLGLSYSFYLVFIKDDPTKISQKEAEAIVTNLYGGKVLDTKVDQGKGNYQLMLDHEKGIYTLSVNRNTKKISNIKLVEKKESLISIEEAEKNIEKELSGQVNGIKPMNKEGKPFVEATLEKDNKHYRIEYDLKEKTIVSHSEIKSDVKPPLSISEEKAKEIALEQIHGQITNLSIVTTQNGKHYKVTVDDQAEGAHVYVQANTGNVSSISWYEEQAQPMAEQPKPVTEQSNPTTQQAKPVKEQSNPTTQQAQPVTKQPSETELENDESDDDDIDESNDNDIDDSDDDTDEDD